MWIEVSTTDVEWFDVKNRLEIIIIVITDSKT